LLKNMSILTQDTYSLIWVSILDLLRIGAFGIHQIKKLEKFIEIRRDNANFWNKNLRQYSDYLLLHSDKEKAQDMYGLAIHNIKPDAPYSEATGGFIETKCRNKTNYVGNIDEQPVMRLFNYRKVGKLPNSRLLCATPSSLAIIMGRQRRREAMLAILTNS